MRNISACAVGGCEDADNDLFGEIAFLSLFLSCQWTGRVYLLSGLAYFSYIGNVLTIGLVDV